MHKDRFIITCINDVYVGILSNMNMVFTESASEAKEVAERMGSTQTPYWWIKRVKLTDKNVDAWQANLHELENLIGHNKVQAFFSLYGDPDNQRVQEIKVSAYVFCL